MDDITSSPEPQQHLVALPMTSRKAAANAVKAAAYGVASSEITTAVSAARELKGNDLDWYWTFYVRHPWVNLCVNLIADSVSAEGYSVVPVEGESRDPIGADDRRTGQIISFLRNAFLGSTFNRALLSTAVDLKVFAVAYWLKKRFGGKHVGFERLDPRTVSRVINEDGTAISSFVVRRIDTSGLLITNNERAKIYSADDVIMFTMGGGDPIYGAPSPIEALDLTIATDWQIRHFREAFFRNGAVAGRVLVNKGSNEDEVKAALAMVRTNQTGSENAFKTVVLTGDWDVFEKAQSGANEVDFIKGSQMARDEIFAVFKVPVGKIFADTKGALGQAGKEADDDTFQRDAVLPVERAIYEALTLNWLHKEVGWTQLELVPKRLNQIRFDRFDAASEIVKFGGTGNEARALAGMPSVTYPGMDIPLFLGQHQPVNAEEATDTPATPPDTTAVGGAKAPETVNKQKNSPASSKQAPTSTKRVSTPATTVVKKPGV